MVETGPRRTGDEIEGEVCAVIRMQQRADVDEAAGGGGQPRIQRVGCGLTRPVGQGAAEFGGVLISNQCVQACIQRVFCALGGV